jgi:hypothetical protein
MKYQPRNRVMVRGDRLLRRPHPFPQQASGQIFRDTVNGFSSTSDIFHTVPRYCIQQLTVSRTAAALFPQAGTRGLSQQLPVIPEPAEKTTLSHTFCCPKRKVFFAFLLQFLVPVDKINGEN